MLDWITRCAVASAEC